MPDIQTRPLRGRTVRYPAKNHIQKISNIHLDTEGYQGVEEGNDHYGEGKHLDEPAQHLDRKFMSHSHCQELGQLAVLASDWLFTL